MELQIGRSKKKTISSFAEASKIFRKYLTDRELGASRMPTAYIYENDVQTHHVSYNGKVWKGDYKDWVPGVQPVYIPSE